MNKQYPSFIRTYVPILVSAVVGWLASIGLNVSDETQTALAVGIGGVAAAAYYAVIRWAEKHWPWVGAFLGSTKSPDSYSKGYRPDDPTLNLPVDDVDAAPNSPASVDDESDEITDDTDDVPDDLDDSQDAAAKSEADDLEDDLEDEPTDDEPDVPETAHGRHAAE